MQRGKWFETPSIDLNLRLCSAMLVLGLLVTGCSSGQDGALDDETAAGETAGAAATPSVAPDVASACQAGARRIVERLLQFTDDLGDVTPQEFLADDDIDGLDAFQGDVAELISRTANQSSTLCDLNGLQRFVDAELNDVRTDDLITGYLVSTIRFGGNVERADVVVSPDDDIAAVLALLDDGSSITFEAGTYTLDSPLLVGRQVTMIGAGRDDTIIESSSADAAIAVFGDGELVLRDIDVSHVGDRPASVVLAFGGSVDMQRVDVGGARGDAERGGTGNGVLLGAGIVPGSDVDPATVEVRDSVLDDVHVSDNDVAGITVNDALAPAITNSRISDNELCGICFLGDAGGVVENSIVESNQFGIQTGDRSAPILRGNTIVGNGVVGVVVVGSSTPLVEQNSIDDNTEAGIAVQEAAAPHIRANDIGRQPFAITVVGTSEARLTENAISMADVGIQIAGEATPVIEGNDLVDIEVAAIVNREQSAATIAANTIRGGQSVAMLVEGSASPMVTGLTVHGGDVGASYRGNGAGRLAGSSFVDQEIAIQVEDEATPVVEANTFEGSTSAAVVVRSDGVAELIGNAILEPETLGIGVAGTSAAVVEGNRVVGGETALSLIENTTATVRDNDLEAQLVSIQVADDARPIIENNRITTATGVGVVYRDTSGGEFRANTIVDPGTIGVQLIDEAAPDVTDNIIVLGIVEPDNPLPTVEPTGDGDEFELPEAVDPAETVDPAAGDEPQITVAVLVSGNSKATVEGNELLGFIVGIQIEATAAPIVRGNVIDGGPSRGVGVLYRDEASGSASGNRTRLHAIGFQVDDEAKPELVDNVVEWASDVAVLIQGSSAPAVDGTSCPSGIAGIGVRAPATPELGTNDCELVSAES